jgi:hypothetical protein
MTFTKLEKLLGDDVQLSNLVLNISLGKFETPYLMNQTVDLLSDESPFCNIISDDNKVSLVKMLRSYFNSCWGVYVDDLKLENFLKSGKMEIYKVEARNGLRYATVNEIAQGVMNLVSEYVYPAGEASYRMLSLLQWTFNGSNYWFQQAGYKLTYTGNTANETLYQKIQLCKDQLNDLLTWVTTPEFEASIKIIKKMKTKGFKYASYEKDEIEESISIKQLVYNIDKTFPRNSNNIDYRRAIALVIKAKQNFKNLSPMDVSFLRNVYQKKALERNEKPQVNEQLKEECEYLLQKRFSGGIDQNHFAYKIVDTLRSKGYIYCSNKQYTIIQQALAQLKKYESGSEEENADENEMVQQATILNEDDIEVGLGTKANAAGTAGAESLVDISDAIGSGLLFEDEEGVF